MAELILEIPTEKSSMDEHREALTAALKEQFPGGLMKAAWEGDVLQLTGPGAKGAITYEEGKLIGRATLGPPASLMKATVEQKITAVLKKVVASSGGDSSPDQIA